MEKGVDCEQLSSKAITSGVGSPEVATILSPEERQEVDSMLGRAHTGKRSFSGLPTMVVTRRNSVLTSWRKALIAKVEGTQSEPLTNNIPCAFVHFDQTLT